MLKCPVVGCGKQCANGTGLSSHMRGKHSNETVATAQTNSRPTPPTPHISADLFSVIKGDIHLRGCEFGDGFLVLQGETLKSYKHLRDAIADAEMNGAPQERPMEQLA